MRINPSPERSRSLVTRPNFLRTKRTSASSTESRGPKSVCPPSEAIAIRRPFSSISPASPRPVPAPIRPIGPPLRRPGLENLQAAGGKVGDTHRRGDEVVEDADLSDPGGPGDGALVHHPGKLGDLRPATDDRSGDSESRGGRSAARRFQVSLEDLFETPVSGARIDAQILDRNPLAGDL